MRSRRKHCFILSLLARGALTGGVLAVLLLSGQSPADVQSASNGPGNLPLTFPIQSAEVASYFNEIARPEDIASFPTPYISLLDQVTAGQRMVGFASWQEAEQMLDTLATKMEWVLYNPEHWENTPEQEKTNLVATIRTASEQTHARGLKFMLAPDRRFAEESLAEAAPFLDAVMLQGQRIQSDPQAFGAWVKARIDEARAANAEIFVFVQVGATLGPAEEMQRAIETVSGEIDGVAVWSMPPTLDILKVFVTGLRNGTPEGETATEDQPSPRTETAAATALSTPDAPANPTTGPTEAEPKTETVTATLPAISAVLPTRMPAPPAPYPDTNLGVILLIALGGIAIGLALGFLLFRKRPASGP